MRSESTDSGGGSHSNGGLIVAVMAVTSALGIGTHERQTVQDERRSKARRRGGCAGWRRSAVGRLANRGFLPVFMLNDGIADLLGAVKIHIRAPPTAHGAVCKVISSGLPPPP